MNLKFNKDRPAWCHLLIISLFTTQQVSNVSTSIFRNLRLIVDLFRVLYCSGSNIEPEQYNTWNKSTIIRKLLKMDVLTFETCWAVNSEIISKWHQVGLSLFNYQDDARYNKHKKHKDSWRAAACSSWSVQFLSKKDVSFITCNKKRAVPALEISFACSSCHRILYIACAYNLSLCYKWTNE